MAPWRYLLSSFVPLRPPAIVASREIFDAAVATLVGNVPWDAPRAHVYTGRAPVPTMKHLSRRLIATGLLVLLAVAAIVGLRFTSAPDMIAAPGRRGNNRAYT